MVALTLFSCVANPDLVQATVPRALAGRLATLNADLPGPLLPSLESRHAVDSIDGSGVLLLASGEEIALAGVNCDARMTTYMQALFFGDEPDTLVYQPSGYVLDGVRYAYVWDIALWELGDPDLEFSPATNSLNESGVISGWCQPKVQDYHGYHSRYVALSELYQ